MLALSKGHLVPSFYIELLHGSIYMIFWVFWLADPRNGHLQIPRTLYVRPWEHLPHPRWD